MSDDALKELKAATDMERETLTKAHETALEKLRAATAATRAAEGDAARATRKVARLNQKLADCMRVVEAAVAHHVSDSKQNAKDLKESVEGYLDEHGE